MAKGDIKLVETTIGVNFKDVLGDSFDKETGKKTMDNLIEQHIYEWCRGHNIDRRYVKKLKSVITPL
jgi:hypothetical protein